MCDLRVAVLCFPGGLEAWQAGVVTRVSRIDGVSIQSVLTTPRGVESDYVTHRSPSRAVTPHASGTTPFAREAVQGVDIVLNLTRADVAAGAAPHVLALDTDDDPAPGRREAKSGSAVTALRVRRNGPRGDILAKAVLKTAPRPRRNAERIFSASPILFERAIRAIRDRLDTALTPDICTGRPSIGERLRRRVSRTVEKLFFRSHWTIGLVQAPVQRIIEEGAIKAFKPLRGLPTDRFHADPFPLRVTDAEVTLLAESAALTPPNKGHLCAITVARNGDVAHVRDALRTPEHLSFPFLLREGEETYCVPECHEAGALRAFRVGDPWLEQPPLLEGVAAVDPVLLQHDGKWWLFCADRAHEDTTHLFLFIADDWKGPWRPHPLNPVKSDVRCSRPAGAIIAHEGALYRPAQDCSERYGGALSVQRITRLSETAFDEEEAFRIAPQDLGRRYVGVHTLNGLADITAIDVLERRFVFG